MTQKQEGTLQTWYLPWGGHFEQLSLVTWIRKISPHNIWIWNQQSYVWERAMVSQDPMINRFVPNILRLNVSSEAAAWKVHASYGKQNYGLLSGELPKGQGFVGTFSRGWNHWLMTLKKILPVPSWPSASKRHFCHSPLTLLALLALQCLSVLCGKHISNPVMPTTLLQNGFPPRGPGFPHKCLLPFHTRWGDSATTRIPSRWFPLHISSSQKHICNCWGGAHVQLHWFNETHQPAQSNVGTSDRTPHSAYIGDTLDFLSLLTWRNCSSGPHKRHST